MEGRLGEPVMGGALAAGRVAETRVVPKAPSGVAEGLLIVTLEDTSAPLRPGMSAKIEIEL